LRLNNSVKFYNPQKALSCAEPCRMMYQTRKSVQRAHLWGLGRTEKGQ